MAPKGDAEAHKIDPRTLNSALEHCISEYVRLYRDRDILRDRWFGGLTYQEIADKYHLSDQYVKQDVIYKIGDPLLIRALDMSGR